MSKPSSLSAEKQPQPSGAERTLMWTARLTAGAMLAQMLVSRSLWGLGLRTFPKVAPWEAVGPDFGETGDFLLFAVTALSLLATAVLPARFFRWSLSALLVLLPIWVLEDVMRLQPWVYQDFLLFALFLYFFWKKRKKEEEGETALQPLRYLMVFTYLWSGLHKLNVHFRANVFEWLTGIFPFTEPLGQSNAFAMGLGVTEAVFALLLLAPRPYVRRAGLFGVTAMHLLILALLVRDNWNHVVWPWNVQMMAMAWLLFYPAAAQVRFPLRYAPQWAVALLLGALPALYLFEKLEPAFSLSMYSGTPVEAFWYWDDPQVPLKCLPPSARPSARPSKRLYLDEWSGPTIQVPLYANTTIYRRMSRAFCDCDLERESRGLEITWFPRWSEKKTVRIPCSELLSAEE